MEKAKGKNNNVLKILKRPIVKLAILLVIIIGVIALIANNAVVKNATVAINRFFHGTTSKSNPTCDTADEASPKPIIIIIGPTMIGGNNLLSHFLPTSLIIIATIT